MMTSFQKYQLHQRVLKDKFGKRYEQWNDPRPKDDRCIFCNIYEKIFEACEVMKGIENNLICCAVNERFKQDEQRLQEISDRFTKLGM